MNEQIKKEFYDSYMFLSQHPAIEFAPNAEAPNYRNPTLRIDLVDKHGYSVYDAINQTFFISSQSTQYPSVSHLGTRNGKVACTYEDVYKAPWEYEKLTYITTLFLTIYEDSVDNHYSYVIAAAKGDTYEECVIKLAEEVRQDFGDFSMDSFDINAKSSIDKKVICNHLWLKWFLEEGKAEKQFGSYIINKFKETLNRSNS